MNPLGRWWGAGRTLTREQRERIAAWRILPEPDVRKPFNATRVVVADVESTGLSVYRDRLIAIGAIAIVDGRVDSADAFYRVLKQPVASDRDNILVHGIGGTAQLGGADPADTLIAFLEYAGKAPLAGFHAGFDAIMIDRAMRRFIGAAFKRRWIDLALVAPAVNSREAARHESLDFWLERYRITAFQRHDALADAVATAQLMQVLAARAGLGTTVAQLAERADEMKWLRDARR